MKPRIRQRATRWVAPTSSGGVIALGLDLIEILRIRRLLKKEGDRFLARVFTPAEAAYARTKAAPAEALAARFAAKEAVMKALGTGWGKGVGWTQIEVIRSKDGAPAIRLTGAAARRAKALGIRRWLVSLTHTAGTAGVVVIGLG